MSLPASLDALTRWAQARPDIDALILVGSHAAGRARSQSDVDLVFLCDEPSYYFGREDWMQQFGPLRDWRDEQWGRVRTRRVVYQDGRELEFNFATPVWAALPLDAGTRRVLEDGYRLLFDRSGQLARRLQQALSQS